MFAAFWRVESWCKVHPPTRAPNTRHCFKVLCNHTSDRLTMYRFGTDIELFMFSMIHGGKYNRIAMPYTDHLGSSFRLWSFQHLNISSLPYLPLSSIHLDYFQPGDLQWARVTPDGALPPKASEKSCRLKNHGLMNAALDFLNWYIGTVSTSECLHATKQVVFPEYAHHKCRNLLCHCIKQQHVSAWSNYTACKIHIEVLCTGCNGKPLVSQGWEPKPTGQTDRMSAAWVCDGMCRWV